MGSHVAKQGLHGGEILSANAASGFTKDCINGFGLSRGKMMISSGGEWVLIVLKEVHQRKKDMERNFGGGSATLRLVGLGEGRTTPMAKRGGQPPPNGQKGWLRLPIYFI
jgi:hypothetical protein